MRQHGAIVIGATLLTTIATGSAQAQLAKTGMVCTEGGMQCRYWEPMGYDATKSYPLVLYFHGAGQSGNDNVSQVDFWGSLPEPMLDRRSKYPAFFVAPQAPAAEGDNRWVNWDWGKGSYDINAVPESASMKKALAIVASLRARYNVDPDRIYVMGESMGGFGTWDAIARHPDMFAAGVPTDGGGSPQAAAKLKNMAILAAHYEQDGAVPSSSDREMWKAVAAAGGRPVYIEIGGPGHGVAGTLAGREDFYAWLFAQRRGVPPAAPFGMMAFSPAGGAIGKSATVSITTDLDQPTIRYTLDGSVPTGTTGTLYSKPFVIDRSVVLQAAAFSGLGTGESTSIFHAATFTLGDAPAPVAGAGGNAGGAAGSPPAGGAAGSSAGAGGSGGSGPIAGNAGSAGKGGGAGGSAGTSTGGSSGGAGTAGGAGSSGGAGAGGTSGSAGSGGSDSTRDRNATSGCALGGHASGDLPVGWVLLGALALGQRVGRRRRQT